MKHQTFRGSLSFDAVPELGTLEIDMAGIQMGRPDRLSDQSDECISKVMQSLGFWDEASNNNNQFYPDIKGASDVLPKPEDFVIVPFRLLSATIVGAGTWKATDFSNADLLRASMEQLRGKPVYKNHDMSSVDNWCGYVADVKWENAYTSSSGVAVPAGINGDLALDARSEPKLVRGVLMGSVYSNSVTVEFDWEMSHVFEEMWDFLDKVGTIGSDGKMIRRVVKAIHNYHETSMVFLGADPFAKLLDGNGELKNIDTSSIEYSKAGDKEKKAYDDDKKFKVSLGVDKNVVSLAKEQLSSKPNTQSNKSENKDENMEQLLLALATALGIDPKSITKDNYQEHLNKVTIQKPEQLAELASLQAQSKALQPLNGLTLIKQSTVKAEDGTETVQEEEVKVTLTEPKEGEEVSLSATLPTDAVIVSRAEFEALKGNVTSLTADAELGRKHLNFQREEAKRLYKLSAGENVKDAVISLMDKASPEELEGLIEQYGKGATTKFGASCKKCGSNELNFRSSVVEEDDKSKAPVSQNTQSSFEDIHNKYSNQGMSLRR